jgi:hypothetical protein
MGGVPAPPPPPPSPPPPPRPAANKLAALLVCAACCAALLDGGLLGGGGGGGVMAGGGGSGLAPVSARRAAAAPPARADLRGCECAADWARAASDASVCTCGAPLLDNGPVDTTCPHYVDPAYLAHAHGRPQCPPHATARRAGAACGVRCAGYNAPVEWFVADCGDPLSPRRPPCGAAASPLPLFEPPGDSALDERDSGGGGGSGADADAGASDASVAAVSAGCRKASRAGRVAPPLALANISIGIVTHEAAAFAASLETYEARGLLGLVGEVLVFMNLRSKEMDAALEPFRERWPGLFTVLDAGLTSAGTPENWSMAMALNALVGASTRRFFLLLERDFQLIEPDTCVLEQLGAAAEMISTGAATAVRLRSRHFEGKPNRAAELFRGSEWLAFETRHWGGFPKYVCSLYHWLEVRGERAHARERARRACAHAFARTRLRARARTLTHAPCMLACNANAARRRRT